MSNQTILRRSGSFSARSVSASRTSITLDARVVDGALAERPVGEAHRVVVRADDQVLGTFSERHDHVPSFGARLAAEGLFNRERLDREGEVSRPQHRGQRLESRVVGFCRFQLPDVVQEPLGLGRSGAACRAVTRTRSAKLFMMWGIYVASCAGDRG